MIEDDAFAGVGTFPCRASPGAVVRAVALSERPTAVPRSVKKSRFPSQVPSEAIRKCQFSFHVHASSIASERSRRAGNTRGLGGACRGTPTPRRAERLVRVAAEPGNFARYLGQSVQHDFI